MWQLEPVRGNPSYFKTIWAKLRPSLMLSSLFQTVTDGSESPLSTVSEHKYLQQHLQHATDWFLTINYKCRNLRDCQLSGFLFLDNSKMWKILTQEVLKARGGFHWLEQILHQVGPDQKPFSFWANIVKALYDVFICRVLTNSLLCSAVRCMLFHSLHLKIHYFISMVKVYYASCFLAWKVGSGQIWP